MTPKPEPVRLFHGENEVQEFWQAESKPHLFIARTKDPAHPGRAFWWVASEEGTFCDKARERRVKGTTCAEDGHRRVCCLLGGRTPAAAARELQRQYRLRVRFDVSRRWKDDRLTRSPISDHAGGRKANGGTED